MTGFSLTGKTNALHGKISSFQQTGMEPIPEAWERLQKYVLACPHYEWLVLQSFYNWPNIDMYPEPTLMLLLEEPSSTLGASLCSSASAFNTVGTLHMSFKAAVMADPLGALAE